MPRTISPIKKAKVKQALLQGKSARQGATNKYWKGLMPYKDCGNDQLDAMRELYNLCNPLGRQC